MFCKKRESRAFSEDISFRLIFSEDKKNEFIVTGSSGRDYFVQVDRESVYRSKCDCPDFVFNGYLCKHIMRVCNFTETEEIGDFGECPICYVNIKFHAFKCNVCEYYFHSDCIHKWKRSKLSERDRATCPMCRSNI